MQNNNHSSLGRANLSYAEKLKDPRWQRKRLEVFNLADFTCQNCGRDEKQLGEIGRQLHAHHVYYDKKKDPWDYPVLDFLCLCDDCHECTEEMLVELRKCLGRVHFAHVNAFIDDFYKASHHHKPETLLTTLRLLLNQPELIEKVNAECRGEIALLEV